MKIKMKVEGMSCEHCQMRVETALHGVGGVNDAKVDLDGGYVIIDADTDCDVKLLTEAIEDAGYDVIDSETL